MCQKCKDKSVLRKFSFKFDAENMKKIKVRKFQNEFMKSSFHPKISTKNLCNEGRNCLTFSQSHFGVACQTAQPIQPISTQIGLDYQYLKKKNPPKTFALIFIYSWKFQNQKNSSIQCYNSYTVTGIVKYYQRKESKYQFDRFTTLVCPLGLGAIFILRKGVLRIF